MTRRLQRLWITDVFLLDLFRAGERPAYEVKQHALPTDVELVHVRFDPAYERVELLISSATFPEVEEGVLPPLLPAPVYRRL